MKRVLLPLLLIIWKDVFAQQSDFIVLKKPNNRTLKTYYPGSFLSAVTFNGFTINGFITDIRNDSIIIQQKETTIPILGKLAPKILINGKYGQAPDILSLLGCGISCYPAPDVFSARAGFSAVGR